MGLTPGSGTTLGVITSPGAGRAQDSPFSDELRHFLLHLLALQLFLQQQFKPSHRAIALGVLLVSLGRRERQKHLGDTSVWSWEEWRIGETDPRKDCCSVAQSCPTLCDPMDCSMPGFPSITISWSWLKLMSTGSVMPSNHLSFCHTPLHLPLIFPSIKVFPHESAPRIRWPKYWSFRFSISPSNEYSGLISFY